MKTARTFVLALACLSTTAFADTLTIQSGPLSVSCNPDTQELTFSRNGKIFADHVKPWDGLGDVPTAKQVDFKDALGQGKGIDIEGSNGTQHIWLVDGCPFVLSRVDLQNTRAVPITVKDITPFTFTLAAANDSTRFFSPEGITKPGGGGAATAPLTSSSPPSIPPPAPASSPVGSPRKSAPASSIPKATAAQSPSPRAASTANTTSPRAHLLQSEVAAVGDFDDARLGLEALADANAKEADIHLRPVMSGYCTWYHAHGSNEKDLKALADFAKQANLKDFGFDFMQIDDGWQNSRRDFSDYKHNGPYPAGMKQTADNLIADGFVAGIWLTPFAWDSKVLTDHLDYFAKTPKGEVYAVKWAGDCFDMTNPDTQKYLSDIVHKITHEWGYKYLKVDGLWSGTATTILYPNPNYRPDDYGNAVFHDPNATNVSAYRTGLRTLRAAAGDDVFICGCNVAQNHRTLAGSIGLLDGMRVGPDINASWANIASRAAVYATREYFLNGRVWWNDPDCLLLRDPITLDQARTWGSFIAISGQLNVVSENLAKLAPEKLDVLKRTMPNIPHEARPLDLFINNQPTIWQAHIGHDEAAHEIVGLFNWDDKNPAKVTLDTKALGLDPAATYVGFDFWENQFVDNLTNSRDFAMKPGSCHILSLVKSLNRPQLVSTSRHVLQGGPDILNVTWDPATNTLKGQSKVVANDPYELRIATGPYTLANATLSIEVKVETTTEPNHARIKFTPVGNNTISWQVQFKK